MTNDTPAREVDVVVVGAGQAGVSTSYYLQQLGIEHVVLERDRAFSSWRQRWDGFRTNTPNWMNTLPVLPADRFPSNEPRAFATRDEMVAYLEDCVAAVDPPLRVGVEVESIAPVDDRWEVQTSVGDYLARCVVLCNGAMANPRFPEGASRLPDLIGQLHSSEYRNPAQIETGSVLIVGSASSGIQICRLLSESGRFDQVHMAVSDVMVLPKHVLGIQIHRLLHTLGLFDVKTTSALGRLLYSGLEAKGDPITRPTPKDLARTHGVKLYPRFTGVDDSALRFADGQTLDAQDLTVVWCTGFRGDYALLQGVEAVFDDTGAPRHERGVVEGAPGLFFVGLRYQHSVASHDIYGVAQDARYVAERIHEHLVGVRSGAPSESGRPQRVQPASDNPLRLVSVTCCVCDGPAVEIATGFDYEYRTSPDLFHAMQCQECGTVFLNPRPDESEFPRIYPADYHTLEFSEDNYSIVHKIRSRLEARRLLKYCEGMPADARILDVGCGDGFHIGLLEEFGPPTWTVEGIDLDSRAVAIAAASGLKVQLGSLEDVAFEDNTFDLVYTIQTLEHVARPDEFIRDIYRILKPGGRLVIVTDNTESIDFKLFKARYWGGYHFPRHWYLFNRSSLQRLARTAGYEVGAITTIVSPVNWVYSIHNLLVAKKAPGWLVDRFSLKAPVSLALFTMLDAVLQKAGRGALLNGFFTKPA